MGWFRKHLRRDHGGGADFVGFVLVFPLVLMPFLFAVQVFLYYQAQSAVYSSAYMTLRAAETYYAPTLADPAVSGTDGELRTRFFDTNMLGQGYPVAAGESLSFTNADRQFFQMDVAYDIPIQYLAPGTADGWDVWGATSDPPTLPVRVHLVGRKVIR